MQDPPHDLGLLAALAEGRLAGEERERVAAHVADCAECRRTLGALGSAIDDGTLLQASPPAATRPSRWSQPRVWLPVAASVLIASFAWLQFAGSPLESGRVPAAGESDAVTDDELLVRRSAARVVAGKTFRMTSGEWIDSSLDPASDMPTLVIRGAEERSAVLQRIPDLAPYSELGNRVTVVWQGTVYRFEP